MLEHVKYNAVNILYTCTCKSMYCLIASAEFRPIWETHVFSRTCVDRPTLGERFEGGGYNLIMMVVYCEWECVTLPAFGG